MKSIAEIIDHHRNLWSITDDEGLLLREQINRGENVVSRINWNGHVTASALVIDKITCLALVIDSIKFKRMLLPGGHVEAGESIRAASLRELKEETGVFSVVPIALFNKIEIPLEINTHVIPESSKRQEPSHLHHDFVYGYFTIDGHKDPLVLNDEASTILWTDLGNLSQAYPKTVSRIAHIVGELT